MRLDRELTCAELVEVITDYLEDRLSERDRERFEEHLVFCDGCGNYLEQMRTTIDVAGRLHADEIPLDLQQRLLAAFRGWAKA